METRRCRDGMGKIIQLLRRRWDGRSAEPEDESEMETCVVCGRHTEVPKELPVSERKTYMPGGGQLCEDCCWEIYHTTDLRE